MPCRSLLLLVCLAALTGAAVSRQVTHQEYFKERFLASESVVSLDPSITITVDQTAFTKDQQPVKVTVKNTGTRSKNDYVSLYSPANPDYTAVIPVWYDQLSYINSTYMAQGDYLGTGQLTFVFTLINWRSDFQFVVVRGQNPQAPLENPIIMAESSVIVNKIVNAPSQVHLALDADEQSIVVLWTSASKTQAVQWGSASGKYIQAKPSTVKTYTRDMMCGGIAKTIGWRDPGYLHEAVIPAGNKAFINNARVYYRVGSAADGYSAEYSFKAPPKAGANGQDTLKFVIFNDVGIKLPSVYNDICSADQPDYCYLKPAGYANGTYFASTDFYNKDSYFINSTKLPKYLTKEGDASLALLIGDLSYAQGYGGLWDWWLTQFETSFAQWPLAVGIGNHERDWPYTGDNFNNTSVDSGGECGVAYRYRMRPISAVVNNYAQSRDFYSFSMGPVHFIILDAETPSDIFSAQYKFVAADLQKVDRKKFPWLIVGVHRMMLSYPDTDASEIDSDMVNMARLQADFFDLFMDYKVDLVVSGHNHAYSRSCPINPSKECVAQANTTSFHNAGAPVFVLAGNAGAGFTRNFDYGYWEKTNEVNYMLFSRMNQNGYLRFSASAGMLQMEAVSDDDGSVFDSLMLTKDVISRGP